MPCLHNGRRHLDFMMKFPEEGFSCTAFLLLQNTYGDVHDVQQLHLHNIPLVGHQLLTTSPLLLLPLTFHITFASSLRSSPQTPSPVNHLGELTSSCCVLQPTLHKLSISLHPTSWSSFLFQSRHDNLERVLQHFVYCCGLFRH